MRNHSFNVPSGIAIAFAISPSAGATSLRSSPDSMRYVQRLRARYLRLPTKILGFDAPGTIGCLATKIVISSRNLVALPNATPDSLPRWAGFGTKDIAVISHGRPNG